MPRLNHVSRLFLACILIPCPPSGSVSLRAESTPSLTRLPCAPPHQTEALCPRSLWDSRSLAVTISAKLKKLTGDGLRFPVAAGSEILGPLAMGSLNEPTGGVLPVTLRDSKIPSRLKEGRLTAIIRRFFPDGEITVLVADRNEPARLIRRDSTRVLYLTREALDEELRIHTGQARRPEIEESASEQIQRLAEGRVADPLLQRPPTAQEEKDFDAKYEWIDIPDPAALIQAATVIGLGIYSDDDLSRRIAAIQERLLAAERALKAGRPTIFPTFSFPTSREATDDANNALISTPRIHQYYWELKADERTFFDGYLERHLPSDLTPLVLKILHQPRLSTAISDTIFSMSNAQIAHDVRVAMAFLLDAMVFYKHMDLRYMNDGLAKHEPLTREDPGAGTLLRSHDLRSELNMGDIPSRDYLPWTTTPEGRSFMKTVKDIDPDIRLIRQHYGWVRDWIAYILPNESAALTLKASWLQSIDAGDDSSQDHSTPTGLQQGGAVIVGQASSAFLLVSDVIAESERRVLAWRLKARGARLYSLPPGVITLDLESGRYWMTSGHIDTVINAVDGFFTEDGKTRIPMDPAYYRAHQEHPELKRFLTEQKITADQRVLVEDSEAGLNVANFSELRTPEGERLLILSNAPKTLARLALREGVSRVLTPPIRLLASRMGLERCLTQRFPADVFERMSSPRGKRLIVRDDRFGLLTRKVEALLGVPEIKDVLDALLDGGVGRIHFLTSTSPFIEWGREEFPMFAKVLIPALPYSYANCARVLNALLEELDTIFGSPRTWSALRLPVSAYEAALDREAFTLYEALRNGLSLSMDEVSLRIIDVMMRTGTQYGWINPHSAPLGMFSLLTCFSSLTKQPIENFPLALLLNNVLSDYQKQNNLETLNHDIKELSRAA